MKSIRIKFLRPILLVVVAIIPLIAACGGASRNDQGTSFSALNWVMCDNMDAFLSGKAGCQMSGETALVGGVGADINSVSRLEELNGIGIKVQNNLTGQTMRVQRVYLEYYIPGANVQPPATSVSAAAFLRANCNEGGEETIYTDVNSTLPDPLCGDAKTTQGVVGFNPVTEDVREFITMNMASMPALPFTMIVTAYVQGVSSSGNTYETNSLDLDVTWDKDLFVRTRNDDDVDDVGSMELTLANPTISVGQTGSFSVLVYDNNGNPVADMPVHCEGEGTAGLAGEYITDGIYVVEPIAVENTDDYGHMSGFVKCVSAGSFRLGCRLPLGVNKRAYVTVKCVG